MSINGREIEAKYYVQDLNRLKHRLEALGAQLVQARVLETNIRLDLPGGRLRAKGRVLRLRRDTEARLTYKGRSKDEQGVLSREEIEFTVGDFEKAKQFLEALGYQPVAYYEKYRTTYERNETMIMLDELPYGNFVEIEGQEVEAIRMLAEELNLNPDTAIATSYIALFERARKALHLSFQDISFANFVAIAVDSTALGVRAADA